jgi:hypothetical protein
MDTDSLCKTITRKNPSDGWGSDLLYCSLLEGHSEKHNFVTKNEILSIVNITNGSMKKDFMT